MHSLSFIVRVLTVQHAPWLVAVAAGRGRKANRTSLRVILSGAVGAPALLVLVRHAKLGVLFTAVHAGVLMHGTAVGTRSGIRRTAGFALLPVRRTLHLHVLARAQLMQLRGASLRGDDFPHR